MINKIYSYDLALEDVVDFCLLNMLRSEEDKTNTWMWKEDILSSVEDLRKAPFNRSFLMVLWMASVCCAMMGSKTCDMGMGMCNQDAEGRSLDGKLWRGNVKNKGNPCYTIRCIYHDNTTVDVSVSQIPWKTCLNSHTYAL